MSDGEFLLIVGSVIVLTTMVFWSHFAAEAARVSRKNQEKK